MQCPYDGKECEYVECGHEYDCGNGLRANAIVEPELDCKWLRDIKAAYERKQKSGS